MPYSPIRYSVLNTIQCVKIQLLHAEQHSVGFWSCLDKSPIIELIMILVQYGPILTISLTPVLKLFSNSSLPIAWSAWKCVLFLQICKAIYSQFYSSFSGLSLVSIISLSQIYEKARPWNSSRLHSFAFQPFFTTIRTSSFRMCMA